MSGGKGAGQSDHPRNEVRSGDSGFCRIQGTDGAMHSREAILCSGSRKSAGGTKYCPQGGGYKRPLQEAGRPQL